MSQDLSWGGKKTEQDSGSRAWHDWRAKHIGASEIAAVLGESDFQTAYGLWQEKTGKKPRFQGNWATERGTQAEPVIRELYRRRTGFNLIKKNIECAELPFLAASLDDYCPELELVVEYKYPSKEKHELAKQGIVPKTYMSQLQQQMLCANAIAADYVSFDGEDIAVIRVNRDEAFIDRIKEAGKAFWQCVIDNTPPALSDKDIISLDSLELSALAQEYKEATAALKAAEAKQKEAKEKIVALVAYKKAEFFGVRITRSARKGQIKYSDIPELQNIDTEKYRSPDSEIITLTIIDKEPIIE